MNAYITDNGIIRNAQGELIATYLDGVLEFNGGSKLCDSVEAAFDALAKLGKV